MKYRIGALRARCLCGALLDPAGVCAAPTCDRTLASNSALLERLLGLKAEAGRVIEPEDPDTKH